MRTTRRQLRKEQGLETTLEDMRFDLAEQEAMTLQTSDVIELLLDGFEGLENTPDEDIRYEWDAIFGEEKK